MKRLQIRLLAFIASGLLLTQTSAPAAEVCRLSKLVPFSDSYERAAKIVPKGTTSDPRKAVVYIEKTAGGYYYHSNFVTPGYDFPTKVGSDRVKVGAEAFLNIVFTEMPSKAAVEQTYQIFRENVQVLVDRSVFDANGIPQVNLDGVKHITIVDGRGGKTLLEGKTEQLDRRSPPPLIMSKVVGCCLYAIPPHLASQFGNYLRARSFRSSEVSFLSLVRDSATEAAIGASPSLSKSRVAGRPKGLPDIEASFRKSQGKTVVLIGHVEGESFVRRDAAGQVEMSVPIKDLRASAKKYDVELIDLGCRTAKEIQSESLSLGVITRFNTLDAVRSMEKALSRSKNYEEFFENLTSEGLRVVVDPGFIREKGVRANVYSRLRTKASDAWIKIAEVFVSYREKS